MLASEFLKLYSEDWPEANRVVELILTYREICQGTLFIDDPSRGRRADAEAEREVQDALFKIADEKGLHIQLHRKDRSTPDPLFDLHICSVCEKYVDIRHSNLSWLMAAAVVQLTTEGK